MAGSFKAIVPSHVEFRRSKVVLDYGESECLVGWTVVDQEATVPNGKRNIGVILVTEATVPSKDIRDGIGISFNPRFRAVGRDSIYGVIRVCTTLPWSLFRATSTPTPPPKHDAALLYSVPRRYVLHAHLNGLHIGKGRNGIPGIVRGFGYGYTFLRPHFATSSSAPSVGGRGESRKRSTWRNV